MPVRVRVSSSVLIIVNIFCKLKYLLYICIKYPEIAVNGNLRCDKTQLSLTCRPVQMDRYHCNGAIEMQRVRVLLWIQIKGAHTSENDANAHCCGHLPMKNMLGSSRGLGLRIFIPATRIRIPYRVPKREEQTAICVFSGD